MTGIQARKVATAFANAMSFIREDASRTALVEKFITGMEVYEHDVPWSRFVDEAMVGCLEQRQKEQRDLKDAEAAVQAAKAVG